MQEIFDELKVSDAMGERRGKNPRQQQRKQASELRKESPVTGDGSEIVHGVQRTSEKGTESEGLVVRLRARQILTELEPDTDFQFSNGWFLGFMKRHRLSMR